MFLNALSFGVLFLIRRMQATYPWVKGLSLMAIVVVNLFNRLIWNILLKVVFIEENYTKAINIMSVMNKSYVSQFINLVVIPIILNTVVQRDNL